VNIELYRAGAPATVRPFAFLGNRTANLGNGTAKDAKDAKRI